MRILACLLLLLLFVPAVSAESETEEAGNSVLFWLMAFTGLVMAGFGQWLKMPLLVIVGGAALAITGLFGITLFENDIRSFTTIFPTIIGIILMFVGGTQWD